MYTLSILITILTILPISYSIATTGDRRPFAGHRYNGTYQVGDKDMSIMIGFDTAGGAVKIDFWHGQLPSIDYNEPDMSCFFACTLLHSHNPKVIELRERRGWQDRYKMEQFNNKFGSILVAGPNDFNKLLYEPSLPRMPKSDRIRLDIDGNVLDLVRCD